ncbi:hypothetical protein K0M31_019424 [Melipona bicolor]|uniref:Uncharacterized protein n=1 Tax=Melipona bicolor TaxID=60889 RepID=A0AA40G2W7_9HYME|nr:hypothetical protein K0M31_019424 [Melipona bicolor]
MSSVMGMNGCLVNSVESCAAVATVVVAVKVNTRRHALPALTNSPSVLKTYKNIPHIRNTTVPSRSHELCRVDVPKSYILRANVIANNVQPDANGRPTIRRLFANTVSTHVDDRSGRRMVFRNCEAICRRYIRKSAQSGNANFNKSFHQKKKQGSNSRNPKRFVI